ncbi:IclR family transcriptional regulator [Paracoccus sp. S-4012]|uniref:IclR family transcriptional regulator n=1 Tax=Paracoccus sp. S-4012 TaxID=2665648 RepID=UPI0018A1D42F|nr:IclR family transcriptional regulator [Paracoccus sp. S-4012]
MPDSLTDDDADVVAAPKRRGGPPAANGEAMSSGKMVGAVVAAIKILQFMAAAREPLGVSRIAKETGLNTSTTFNILRTLMLYDFVQFEQLSKTYTLSLGILGIAQAAMSIGGDIGTVRPAMERLAQEHGVTVTLWQPTGRDRKILIMAAQPRSSMRIQMAVGQRLPLLIGATGRIFAAFSEMSVDEIRRQFEAIRWNGPLTFKEFMEQVAEAREQGWAEDAGNFAQGTVLLSTPILDQDGHAALAVTANMFAGQYDPERAKDIIRDLEGFSRQAARALPG